ncbi:hypothetical protein L9F63_018241, partial [Diploptera punctata]
ICRVFNFDLYKIHILFPRQKKQVKIHKLTQIVRLYKLQLSYRGLYYLGPLSLLFNSRYSCHI